VGDILLGQIRVVVHIQDGPRSSLILFPKTIRAALLSKSMWSVAAGSFGSKVVPVVSAHGVLPVQRASNFRMAWEMRDIGDRVTGVTRAGGRDKPYCRNGPVRGFEVDSLAWAKRARFSDGTSKSGPRGPGKPGSPGGCRRPSRILGGGPGPGEGSPGSPGGNERASSPYPVRA